MLDHIDLTKLIFGRLTWDAIPFHEPILLATFAGVALGGIALVAALTYFRVWGTLWRDWITSIDHKKIGIMYMILGLIMLLRGFADALMMRTQQAIAFGDNAGFLPPHHVVHQARHERHRHEEDHDHAVGGEDLVVVVRRQKAGSPDVGVDYYIWSLQIAGVGTLLSGVNLIATIVKMRAPGMTWMRMPIFTWTSLCTNILIVAAFPVLTAVLAMLALDRTAGFNFFTTELGGNAMMYVNLIWIWGHPEVYILILPLFGVFSEVVATFCSKRLFGYASMVSSL